MLFCPADPNPHLKRKRRPNITSEGLQTPSSAKRKSESSAAGSDQKRRRIKRSVHLDLDAFVSLSETVMARVRTTLIVDVGKKLRPLSLFQVCRHLHPVDMLALSRTSKVLRAIFTSKRSKPCWDESRLQLDIPDWRHVSSPRAMVFIFERTCQATGCEERARLQCAYVCRKYCARCAEKNLLEATDVQQKWPELPEDLVTRLMWTPKLPATSTNEVRKGRFYLREDVLSLLRHFQRLKDQPSWATTAFRADLISKQRQRAAAAVEIRVWLARTVKRQQARFKERWLMISAVMASRWRWDPVPYEELPGRLKEVVDYLIKLSNITEDTWNRVRGDLTRAIKAKGPGRDQAERPFSLRGAGSSERELAPSK
ncbi:hypothetical protein FS837_010207 [Tulasnella sp. UAMH 9824]|nr:hypothetical protein FS837_010207 [Tulasnella sp. UAMH 9824]